MRQDSGHTESMNRVGKERNGKERATERGRKREDRENESKESYWGRRIEIGGKEKKRAGRG